MTVTCRHRSLTKLWYTSLDVPQQLVTTPALKSFFLWIFEVPFKFGNGLNNWWNEKSQSSLTLPLFSFLLSSWIIPLPLPPLSFLLSFCSPSSLSPPQVLKAFRHSYHPKCFCCDVCGMCLDGIPYASDSSEKIYCTPAYHRYDVKMMSSKKSTNRNTLYLHQCIQVQMLLCMRTGPILYF